MVETKKNNVMILKKQEIKNREKNKRKGVGNCEKEKGNIR